MKKYKLKKLLKETGYRFGVRRYGYIVYEWDDDANDYIRTPVDQGHGTQSCDYREFNISNCSIVHTEDRYFRFRKDLYTGEYVVDISKCKENFDRWANSTQKSVLLEDFVSNIANPENLWEK